MAEYIEREAALREVERRSGFYDAEWGNKRFTPDDVEEIIRNVPAADVVARDCFDRLLVENDELRKERPVVRCGECKHRHDDNFCGGRGWPEQLVPDDGYCDRGARMGGDGE